MTTPTPVSEGDGAAFPLLTRIRRTLRPRTRITALGVRLRKSRFGLRPLHNLLIDLRFGGLAGGRWENPYTSAGAFPIQSVDYATLDRLHRRNGIVIAPEDVLVDVGCGRGRVLNWWLSQGLSNRLVGLELVPEVARHTAHRLRRYREVTVVAGDAIAHLPADGTFFFLYSPFDREVMVRFRDAVRERVRDRARILYFNCRFLDAFRGLPDWEIRELDSGEPEPAALITRR